MGAHETHALNIGPNGEEFEQLVATGNHVMRGTYRGGVCVEEGATFELLGDLHGSLWVHESAIAVIAGQHHGSVHVDRSALVRLAGKLNGSVHVSAGARVDIEAQGRLAGSIHNDGLIVLRGAFGGTQSGNGDLKLEDGGYIKQPSVRDGIRYYEWHD